jgi:hypothetical protein
MTTSKRRKSVPAEKAQPPSHPPATTTVHPPSLEQIRARALNVQADAVHTIAELEAWRAEIDSTIAFLKAQRR